jgi:hypothetical protein
MAFTYTVQLNDPYGLSQDNAVIAAMQAAAAAWSEYLTGVGPLEIQINVTSSTTTRESGDPTTWVADGSTGARTDFLSGASYELLTGIHANGATSDVIVNIDRTFLQDSVWFNPNPSIPAPIPLNLIDGISAFTHELGHAFGIDGFRNPTTGALPSNEQTNWDRLVQIEPNGSAFFVGANAEAVYGGPVPVTSIHNGEQYVHLGNNINDPMVGQDLMNGVAFKPGQPYFISNLDVAILEDIGAPVNVYGNASDEVFSALGTNATFIGAGNHDELTFDGPQSQFSIATPVAGSVTISDTLANRDGIHNLTDIEDLQFTDKTVFVEDADNANIARLYSAALDRPPDPAGLHGWEDAYANGISTATKADGVYTALAETGLNGGSTTIVDGFTQSPEFQQKYGALSDAGFVTQLYYNVLDRAPDPAELGAWLDAMANHGATRDIILVGFAESPENIAKAASDWLITV